MDAYKTFDPTKVLEGSGGLNALQIALRTGNARIVNKLVLHYNKNINSDEEKGKYDFPIDNGDKRWRITYS